MADWLVAMVRTGSEFSCALTWVESGLSVYVPRGQHLRRDRRPHRSALVEIDVPAFPGYVFVKNHQFNGYLRAARGFRGVLKKPNGMSLLMTQEQINELEQKENAGVYNGIIPEQGRSFKAGDIVVICNGPLIGITANISEDSDGDTVKALVEIFNRNIVLNIPTISLSTV